MKYKIEIREAVTRTNKYTIDVENEKELERLICDIEDEINSANHPDDIIRTITGAGCEIVEFCEGAEDLEYELM